MTILHSFQYLKPHFVGIGWVTTTTGLSADEISDLIRRNDFPLPTPNATPGTLVWDRAEVLAWVNARGLQKTLRRREFVG